MPAMRPNVCLLLALFAAAPLGCLTDFDRFHFEPDGNASDAGPPSPDDAAGARDDSGPADAGRDGGDGGRDAEPGDTGMGDAAPRIPSGAVQTPGGALLLSPTYRLRVSIGAPQPFGRASQRDRTLHVGPEAAWR